MRRRSGAAAAPSPRALEAVGVEPGGQVAAAAQAPPRARAPPRTGPGPPLGRRRWRRPARRPPAFRAGSRRRSRRVGVSMRRNRPFIGVGARRWKTPSESSIGSPVAAALPPAAPRQAATTRAAIRSAENSSARAAAVDARDRPPRGAARSAARHASRSYGAQSAPSIPCSATGWIADRRPERRHAARERLDHRQPEALGLRGHEHRVGGVDPVRDLVGGDAAHRAAAARRRPPRARGRSASAAATGRAGTAGTGPRGRARAARAPRARGIGRKRVEVDAARQHRDAPRRARAGDVLAELARDRGGQRREAAAPRA